MLFQIKKELLPYRVGLSPLSLDLRYDWRTTRSLCH